VDDPEHPAVAVDPKAADFGLMSRMSNSQMSGDPMKGMVISGLPQGGTMRITFGGAGLHIESSSTTRKTVADDLTQYLDRPVMDKTKLAKHYQVAIDVSMEDMRTFRAVEARHRQVWWRLWRRSNWRCARGDSEPAGASILASLQQQLGLKLETQKAPIEVVVVDYLEKTPLDN